jgi:hypothetical protein
LEKEEEEEEEEGGTEVVSLGADRAHKTAK